MQYKFRTIRLDGSVSTTTYNNIPDSFKAFVQQYFSQVLCMPVPNVADVVLTDSKGIKIDSAVWPANITDNETVFVKAMPALATKVATPQAPAQVPEPSAQAIETEIKQELKTDITNLAAEIK